MRKLLYFCLCVGLYFISNTISIYATTYEYDELGRVTQVTNEDGSSVTYVYDANGNLVEIKTEAATENSTGGNNVTDNSGADDSRVDNGGTDAGGTDAGATDNNATTEGESAEHSYTLSGVEDHPGNAVAGITILCAVATAGGVGLWLLPKKKKKDQEDKEQSPENIQNDKM